MADEAIELDLEDFTLDEIEEMQKLSGIPFQQMNTTAMPVAALKAAVCILKRRDDPSFSMEDAGKVKLRQFGSSGNGGGAKRPTRSVKPRPR